MPLETAAGGISLCEEHLADTLADCARFRTWAKNAPNRAAARARIYFDGLPPGEDGKSALSEDQIKALRPFALIATGMQNGYSRGRVATQTYVEAGLLTIVFEENVPERLANDAGACARQFKTTLGQIIGANGDGVDGLLDLAYGGGYLAIDQVTLHGPVRVTQEDAVGEGDHQFAALEIRHGVGQQ